MLVCSPAQYAAGVAPVGTTVYYPFGGAVDSYTFKGDPAGESWHPRFTYHGFQFVEVGGWPSAGPKPTAANFKQLVVHSDNTPLGA
jgi:hypothetical protein